MSTYTLTYFDIPGSRGEECRLALHLAGVPFTDVRVDGGAWASRKQLAPFGSLPFLEVEGKGTLAQSNAILSYLGRAHGLLPADPWEAARHEAVMAAVEDLRAQIGPTTRMKDEVEKKARRLELATGFLPAWGAQVERQIGEGPFLGGAKPSVADLKLYVVARWIAKGILDHIPADLFAQFPKLTRLAAAVGEHPEVARWNALPTSPTVRG